GSMEKISDAAYLAASSMEQDFIDAAQAASDALDTIPRSLDIDVNTYHHDFGGGGGGNGGPGPDFTAQGGLHMTTPLAKDAATILMHRGEVAHVDKPERMPGGDVNANFTISISGAAGDPQQTAREVQAAMDKWLRDNRGGFRSAIVRTAERG
ncbi:MAG: hypothetical protein ACYTBX_19565, partial [Planctomycetota bacterium]